MNKSLLYITKLERCAARHLRRAHIAGDTAIVRDPMPWRDMCLCGLASMESETEEDEGVTTVSTTLTARLRTDIVLKDEPQIFRLTTPAEQSSCSEARGSRTPQWPRPTITPKARQRRRARASP